MLFWNILALGALAALGVLIATGWVISRPCPDSAPFDYLVVLGTMVNGDTPSIMLHERILAAQQLMQADPRLICVPSGEKTPNATITEGRCIARELEKLGISPDRIWPEEKATSTTDNLLLSMALIRQRTGNPAPKVGVLTSDFHAYRAAREVRRLGLDAAVIGIPTRRTRFYYPAFLREIIAVWYYILFKRN